MLDSNQDIVKNYQDKKRLKEKEAFRKQFRRRAKSVLVWGVVILTIAFTGGGIFLSSRQTSTESIEAVAIIAPYVKTYEDQGRAHTPNDKQVDDYNSNPPTSGPHHAELAKWGIYENELRDEQLVHNLEHCGIWISYRPDIASEFKASLASFARGFPTKVIMAPRAKNDAPVVLAAWRTLLPLEMFDEIKMSAFVLAFLNKAGPECNAL